MSSNEYQVMEQKLKKIYPEFSFNHYLDKYPKIKIYLIELMINSYKNSVDIRRQLPDLIHDVEIFFEAGIKTDIFNDKNINNILKSLTDSKEGFEIIEFLPPNLSGIYGMSIGNKIQINSKMTRHGNSPDLTATEIRRLYMFHEMGHKILNILSREKDINIYVDTLEKILEEKGMSNLNLNEKRYIYHGFFMIEECLTQELAEFLTYYSSKKKRPDYTQRIDLNCSFKTNQDYYGIFQEPTINFGRTLRGCADYSGEKTLLNLIKKALNSNFVSEVVKEYYQGGAKLYSDLYLMLVAMGIIKEQKYASFGFGQRLSINVKDLLALIKKISKEDTDYRNYPEKGFPEINFEQYKNRTEVRKR